MDERDGKRETWQIPQEMAECCRDAHKGAFRSAALMDLGKGTVSLAVGWPPVSEQAYGSTCIAHAVAMLVAYAEKPEDPPRLSAQFLFDMVKRNEDEWIGRNLESVRNGLEPDEEFRLAYKGPYERLQTTIRANGGPTSAVSVRMIGQFEAQLRGVTGVSAGSMLHRCFEVVREQGICGEDLRPASSVQRVSAASRLGEAGMPQHILRDALRHRVTNGLTLLEHPNNVNEIRKALAGAEGMRPMPVCAAVDIFEGCVGGTFAFPEITEEGTSANRPLGLHEVLVVGYEDDETEPGGGRFTVRNSWGAKWGEDGYGKMPYAYLETFCHEAGTIRVRATAGRLPAAAGRAPGTGGGVCSVCGKTYFGESALKYRCEEPGCEERICFDCRARKNARRCQKHASPLPKTT